MHFSFKQIKKVRDVDIFNKSAKPSIFIAYHKFFNRIWLLHTLLLYPGLNLPVDVSSLFTNVPIQEAVQVIKKKLKEDQSLPSRTSLTLERITELLEICLNTTYLRFQGRFYEQQKGAAMGSPVSAIVANMYMEHFKEFALRTALERPRVWKEIFWWHLLHHKERNCWQVPQTSE